MATEVEAAAETVVQATPRRTQPATARILKNPSRAEAMYQVRLARTAEEVREAQRLRFRVFNLELGRGLVESFGTGHDTDAFDVCCDHLVVTVSETGAVVGTYRMQTGHMAQRRKGYFSAGQFDLTPFQTIADQLVELGRACIDPAHRNLVVLNLLWRGIAEYARQRGARYLFGCSSLHLMDSGAGASLYAFLRGEYLAPPPWRTRPWPHCACPLDRLADGPVLLPRLMAGYLALGARVCGPPAVDREFGTIDFLTLLDLEALPNRLRKRWFIR